MDSIIQEVGGCGQFQICQYILTHSCYFISVWGILLMAFGSHQPEWECIVQLGNDSLIHNSSRNGSLSSLLDATADNIHGIVQSKFHMTNFRLQPSDFVSSKKHAYEGNNSDGDLIVFNNITNELTIKDVSCRMDYRACDEIRFIGNSSTVVSAFGLVCDKAWIPSFIVSIQMIGVIFGSYIGHHLGDVCGMKLTLYGNLVLVAVSSAIAVICRFWEMYAVFLFLVGFGIGGIFSSFSFSLEFMTSDWRNTVRVLPVWSFSSGFFAIAAVLLNSWKNLHLLVSASAAIIFFGVFCVSPSIKWLLQNDFIRKAESAVRKIAEVNNNPMPRCDLLDTVAEELGSQSHQLHSNSALTSLCVHSDVRKLTFKLSYLWLFTAVCYFGLTYGIKSLPGDFHWNLIIACLSDIPAVLIVFLLLKCIGGHLMISIFLFLAASTSLAIPVYFFIFARQGLFINICFFVAKASSMASWYGISIATVQFFPETVRAMSLEFFDNIFYVGGLLSASLIPYDEIRVGICLAVMSLFMWLALPVLFTLPQTEVRPNPKTPPRIIPTD